MDRTILFKRSAVAIGLLAALSGVSVAEELSNDESETITVLGTTYRNTATKTALQPEETPQGVSVVDNEQLEQRSVKSLNQVLRYTTGVSTENRGSSVTMFDTFNIRGFDVEQSHYDGLLLQFLNGWNLQPQIDPIAMQQVEVFKGPTSVLYGSMPPGGMVNIIAKSPQNEPSTKVSVAGGSRDLMEASIDTTGQLDNSDFSYRLIALARKQDSQVDNATEERYVFAPSLNWQMTDRTLLNVNLYYQNDPAMGINSSVPIISGDYGSTSPTTSAGDVNWSSFEREVLMLGYKLNHDFGNGWTFLQNARYTDADLFQKNTYHLASQFDETTGDLDRNVYTTDEKSNGFAIDNQISAQIMSGDVEHNLLFGLDYQKLDGESNYISYGSVTGFNIYDPDNDLIDVSSLEKDGDYLDKVSVEQLGIYFQDQIRYNRWVFIGGGRYDWYQSESDYSGSYAYSGTWYDYSAYEEADQKQFSYRLGGLYEFDNGVSPFLSYATSFEPAAGLDGDGDAYKPELGQQVEAGVKFVSNDMSYEATASVFHIVKSDALMADPEDPWAAALQVGELTSQGIELEGRWYVNDAVDIEANYTYVDMEITEDTENGLEGTTPIYIPTHAANLWVNYYALEGALSGTRVSGGVRYVGEKQMNAENTAGMVPSYVITDVSVGYDLGEVSASLKNATANLVVNNIFNQESYTCYDESNCWYGAERSLEFKVDFKF
jgi:iron complex outermembrane receptor protein